jgi:short-subunit dehydrogenase
MASDSKYAVLTGSASGLGRALAVRLARDGYRLALVDLNDAGNDETLRLVRSAGGDGFVHRMDVSQSTAWEQLRDRLRGEWPRIDLLVNNAGVAGSGEVGAYSIDDWHWILGINLNAGIYGCHYFIPWLKENPRGAHVVNIASMAAVASKPGMAGYNVAKAGMLSLSESIYGELKRHNVGVTVVCPSFFQTNLLKEGRLEKLDKDTATKMMQSAKFTAEDVANEIVRAIEQKRLYVVMPSVGRRYWWLKRLAPTFFCNMLAKDWAREKASGA